ncbi:MAG: hypothetical protein ABSF29_00810 [Tepidisphaeraceae bacterium]
MVKSNEAHEGASDAPKEQFATDFEALKQSFGQLREDVTRILGTTLEVGKGGAESLKYRARHAAEVAAGEVKDYVHNGKEHIHESFDKLGHKIEERPLTSAAIALGIGFILGTILHSKR